MCPGCLSLIHSMSIYTGTEHEFESVCWPCVCVCVHCESSDGGAVPAILCDHEGRGSVQQFFSHFVKSISAQLLLLLFPSLVSSHWEHYATSPPLYQDGTQRPAVFDCFQAGPNSAVWLESVFLMDFFYRGCCFWLHLNS